MATPTPLEVTAFDLIDLLHFNDVLVNNLFTQENQAWFDALRKKLNQHTEKLKKPLIETEIIKHYESPRFFRRVKITNHAALLTT